MALRPSYFPRTVTYSIRQALNSNTVRAFRVNSTDDVTRFVVPKTANNQFVRTMFRRPLPRRPPPRGPPKDPPKTEPNEELSDSTALQATSVHYLEQPKAVEEVIDVNTAKHELQTRPGELLNFKILGQETQIVQIDLGPNEGIRAETGSLLYMTEGIEMETSTMGGISQGFQRMLTGGSLMLTDFVYKNPEGTGRVVLGTEFPSKIHPVRLEDYGGSLIAQKGAFLCGTQTIDIQMEFTKKFSVGFFGGEGFVLQRLTGQGTCLVKAGGALIKRTLRPNESLRVSTGSLVAFEPSVSYDIQMIKGFKNVIFGGEGLFLTTLTGPGVVILQGLPFDRMVDAIARRIPGGGGGMIMPIGMGGGGGGGASGEAGTAAAGAGVGPGMAGAADEMASDTTGQTDSGFSADTGSADGDQMSKEGWSWSNDDGGAASEESGGFWSTLGGFFGSGSDN